MGPLTLVSGPAVSRSPTSSTPARKRMASCSSQTADSSLPALLQTAPLDQQRPILLSPVTIQTARLIPLSASVEKPQFPFLIARPSRVMHWLLRLTTRSSSQAARSRPYPLRLTLPYGATTQTEVLIRVSATAVR